MSFIMRRGAGRTGAAVVRAVTRRVGRDVPSWPTEQARSIGPARSTGPGTAGGAGLVSLAANPQRREPQYHPKPPIGRTPRHHRFQPYPGGNFSDTGNIPVDTDIE